MKHLLIFISFLLFASKICFFAQEAKAQDTNYIFNPKADAKEDLQNAIIIAKKENKNVLIIVGGDWDYWSRFFNDVFNDDSAINSIITTRYVYVRINFSPLNKNEEILSSLACPKREGYPIFIILDNEGKKLHLQNADDFKKEFKFKRDQFIAFLHSWSPK